MNIFIANKHNKVGMVICDNNNSVYYYGTFETQTIDKESQIILASQRAVSYIKTNKLSGADNTINIYSDKLYDLQPSEYLEQNGFTITSNIAETDKEKQRLLLANVEIDMAIRRAAIGLNKRDR
jgi:hypothetical protein